MIVRKALLVACAAALTTTPAWAAQGRAPSTPVGPPAERPARNANPGTGDRSPKAGDRGPGSQQGAGERSARGRPDHPAKSRRCKPRRVAYVAAGTLLGHTLVLDGAEPIPTVSAAAAADGPDRPTYSGEVTIDVKRTNRHARPDKGTTKTYVLEGARVLLRIPDLNGDEVVDLADVVPDSRAKVIGKVTKLPRRCDQTGFEPELTIRKLLIHPPRPAAE